MVPATPSGLGSVRHYFGTSGCILVVFEIHAAIHVQGSGARLQPLIRRLTHHTPVFIVVTSLVDAPANSVIGRCG
jgi:hypothetical protein